MEICLRYFLFYFHCCTEMIFPGVKDRTERANLIAYLETLK